MASFPVVASRRSQAYELLRCLGGELYGQLDQAMLKGRKHLEEHRAAATVREETVEGILNSMLQELRREEAPERRFNQTLGFSLANLRKRNRERTCALYARYRTCKCTCVYIYSMYVYIIIWICFIYTYTQLESCKTFGSGEVASHYTLQITQMLVQACRRGSYSPGRIAELAEARLQEIDQEDEQFLRQVQLVQGWIATVKGMRDEETISKEYKSLETFLSSLADDFLGAREGLKKEVEKQEPEWRNLARHPIDMGQLEQFPRLEKLAQRRSCKELTAREISKVLLDLRECWKKHLDNLQNKSSIPSEPPGLKMWYRGDVYKVDPTKNDKRAQAVAEFFVRNAKWRERWDQADIPACVKRALKTAKDQDWVVFMNVWKDYCEWLKPSEVVEVGSFSDCLRVFWELCTVPGWAIKGR